MPNNAHTCSFCGKTGLTSTTSIETKTLAPEQLPHLVVCIDCLPYLGECISCKQLFDLRTSVFIPEVGLHCPGCVKKEVCTSCGEEVPSSHIYGPVGCIKCTKVCEICGERHKGTGEICSTCASKNPKKCALCGKYHVDYTHSHLFGIVCKNCATVGVCPVCNEQTTLFPVVHLKDKLAFTGDRSLLSDGNKICISCYPKLKLARMSDYSHQTNLSTDKFKPHFKPNTLYFGIENEIELRRVGSPQPDLLRLAYIGEMMETFGREKAVFKSDSSLYNGVECVFFPMTYSYIQENKAQFEQLFVPKHLIRGESTFKRDDGHVTHAGMHVHLSKDAFTTLHKMKFIHFIQTQSDFIFWIAGRTESSYAKAGKDSARIKASAGYQQGDRYERVNMCPAQTMEVRVFAGAFNSLDFFKNLDFLHALYVFTQSVALTKTSVGNFITFVMDSSDYSDLKKWFSLPENREKFEQFSKEQTVIKE